ncbi:MAG: N-acetyl-gamma-glutamyl-phosphate reductase [Myxococcota bacterium]|nr:N-acetyl-gamma-glutamyl-phosphate reductase [Myxococcota bacterium]
MTRSVGIVGISGYAGIELHRILETHPMVRVSMVAAGRAAGEALDGLWPRVDPRGTIYIEEPDTRKLAERCEVVFLALPHGVSAGLVAPLLDAGLTVIDVGADFRLPDPAVWKETYGSDHAAPELLSEAVYGLPEKNREALHGARLVACPGCYPTAVAVAAMPLLEEGLADFLIADCLSGVSGAGRKAGTRNLYGEVNDSSVAYGLGGTHRHVVEMEQLLGVPVSFTPHLVPMTRGMLATVHARPAGALPDAAALTALFERRYAGHPMVQVAPRPPATREVRGTARARVHAVVDEKRGVITVTSAIDNLGKGAAGQAVHCMNLALGIPETTGLPVHPFLP